MILLAYFATGFLASLVGALTGLGGGFIIVPVAHLILGMPFKDAVFFSLCSIFLLSILKMRGHRDFIRKKRNLLLPLAIFSVMGSFIASLANINTPAEILIRSFGIFMILVAIYIFWDSLKATSTSRSGTSPNWIIAMCIFLSGGISGLFGVGGGILNVPIFNQLLRYPMREAAPISFFFILVSSSTALITHLNMRRNEIYEINFLILLLLMLGTALGYFLSRSIKLSNKQLQLLFAAILIILGIAKIYSTL